MKNSKTNKWKNNSNCIKYFSKDKKYKIHGWKYRKNCIKFKNNTP